MYGSMVDIQSAAAKIRRGKKRRKNKEQRTNDRMKMYIYIRQTINKKSRNADIDDELNE